ncbi:MAG: hypothetical protein IPM56_06355 [Ignavibacteriales bacterium]|nr:MAG: hypothetical protein IPM56_06355 [Ignavibacteriales bacterium]
MAELKKLVAAILVPLILFQYTGCRTYDIISTEEIKNHSFDKTLPVITKDGRKFILSNQDSADELDANIVIENVDCYYCYSWEVIGDTLLLKCSTRDQLSKAPVNYAGEKALLKIIESESYRLNPDDIEVAGYERFDTGGLVLGIFIAIFAVGLIIKIIESNADFGGGHKF